MKKQEKVNGTITLENHPLESFRKALSIMEKLVRNSHADIQRNIIGLKEFQKCTEQGQATLLEMLPIIIQEHQAHRQSLIDDIHYYVDDRWDKSDLETLCVHELEAISEKIQFVNRGLDEVDEMLEECIEGTEG